MKGRLWCFSFRSANGGVHSRFTKSMFTHLVRRAVLARAAVAVMNSVHFAAMSSVRPSSSTTSGTTLQWMAGCGLPSLRDFSGNQPRVCKTPRIGGIDHAHPMRFERRRGVVEDSANSHVRFHRGSRR